MNAGFVLLALVALSAFVALTPVAEASHRCYTLGDYQVCHYIPGDEALDWVRDGCVPVGDNLYCLA
jgi:hypothetical protein